MGGNARIDEGSKDKGEEARKRRGEERREDLYPLDLNYKQDSDGL